MKTFLKIGFLSLALLIMAPGQYVTGKLQILKPPEFELVLKDTNGVVIEYKEKYGFYHVDTGTILMKSPREYLLIRKDFSKAKMMKENLINFQYKKIEPPDTTGN